MSIRIIHRGKTFTNVFWDEDTTNSDLYEIVSKRLEVPRRTLKLTSTDDLGDIYNVRDNQEFFQFAPIIYADVPYMEHLDAIFEGDETKKLVDYPNGTIKKSSKSLADEFVDITRRLDEPAAPVGDLFDKLNSLIGFGLDPNAEIEL